MKILPSSRWLLVILGIVIIALLCQYIRIRMVASNEAALRKNAEWTVLYGIGNVGQSVSVDSIAKGHHLLLRYDSSTCLTCIAKAEKLLVDVFGMEYLRKELCCIGERGQVQSYKDVMFIESSEPVTPMDEVYTPYFCVVGDNGEILFTLSLVPDMYDYNRKILKKLKRTLKCGEE